MIKKVTVINDLGDSIVLDITKPELSGFVVRSITGIGPGSASVNISEIATNDGGIYTSAKLPARNIVISLLFLECPTIEEARHKTYRYFPIKKKIRLIIETDLRVAEIEGYVEENDPEIFSSNEGADISIICPNPFFYSADDSLVTTYFYGIEPTFEFPFSNESLTDNLLTMGEIKASASQAIRYDGDFETGITMTIHAIGPASNITIYNSTTRERMIILTDKLGDLAKTGLAYGDDIVICTIKGQKSVKFVREGKSYNALNCLDKKSDWIRLVKGDNILAYKAETGGNNLQFKVENRVIYEGV